MDEMEFTEAESNMHDLVILINIISNFRLLNINNTRMPQSIKRKNMMRSNLLRNKSKHSRYKGQWMENSDQSPFHVWSSFLFNFSFFVVVVIDRGACVLDL